MFRREDSCQINSNYDTNSDNNQQAINGISTPFYVKDILNFTNDSTYTGYDIPFVKSELFDYGTHSTQQPNHWESHYMMYQHDSPNNYEQYNGYPGYHRDTNINNNCVKFDNGYAKFQHEVQETQLNLPAYPADKSQIETVSKEIENISKFVL